jgi:hypothetical protein
MQRTADFHDAIANAGLPQAAGVVDDAATLDAAVDVLKAHAAARDAPIRRLLRACEVPASRFAGGMMISTRSSVNARNPRSWSKRLPAGKGYGVASAIR